jgi:hypothetical protein
VTRRSSRVFLRARAELDDLVATPFPIPERFHTPQYADAQLCAALGRNVVVKVEMANPLRSFKGRGAEFLMARLDAGSDRPTVVCSSTGNFAQAMPMKAVRISANHTSLETSAAVVTGADGRPRPASKHAGHPRSAPPSWHASIP